MKTIAILSLTLLSLLFLPAAHAVVTFDWATIGSPGNADDIHGHGYGGVDYTYNISKHEVTNAKYAEFLNAVALTDSFGGADPWLYSTNMGSSTLGGITRSGSPGSYTYSVKPDAIGQGPGGADGDDYTYANKPVVYVSFFDAMRFTNWLQNGQGGGDTESGVYNISDGGSEVRSASAKYWIPSEDEWYKAAYYDPNGNGGSGAYYDFPTSTDTTPNNNLPSADTGNSANFSDSVVTTGNPSYPMTDVGAYALSGSPYGTFDQGGNVWEWNAVFGPFPPSPSRTFRGFRAGSFRGEYNSLRAAYRTFTPSRIENSNVGFRVATVPEPTTALLALLGATCVLRRRRWQPNAGF